MSRNPIRLLFFRSLFFIFSFQALTLIHPLYAQPPSENKPLILAHYMTWFGLPKVSGEWFQWKFAMEGVALDKHHYPDLILADGRNDIAAVHYPSIGPYDSTDPDLLEYHILLAKEAGIEGFMVNWYGFEDKDGKRRQEDKGFEQLLKAAEKLNFKVCINYDDKSSFPPYRPFSRREEAVQFTRDTLRRAFEKYGRSPAYLKIEDRPVFSNFGWSYVTSNSMDQTSFSVAEWKAILGDLRAFDPYFIHDHQWDWRKTIEEAGFDEAAQSVYSWIGRKEDRLAFLSESEALVRKRKLRFVTATINPGFDNTPCWGWGGGISQVPRRDGEEYREQMAEASQYGAGLLHLATWNDFTEGSTIEPTREYGFLYLQITAEAANRWTPGAPYGKAFDLPEKIYRMRSAAKTLIESRFSSYASVTQMEGELDRAAQSLLAHDRPAAEQALKNADGMIQEEFRRMPKNHRIEVSLAPSSLNLFAGDQTQLTLRIKNLHQETVPLYVELDRTEIPRSWLGDLERVIWLKPGEEKSVNFTLTVPSDAKEMVGWFTANVDSPYLPVTSNVSHLRVYRPFLTGQIGPVNLIQEGREESLSLTLDSRQKLPIPASFSVQAPAGWLVRATQTKFELPMAGEVSIPFSLKIPTGAPHSGSVEARVSYGNAQEFVIREPYQLLPQGQAALLEGDLNQDGAMDYVLGNELFEMHCTAAIGGRILSLIWRPSRNNQVFLNYPRAARTQGSTWDKWAEYGGINDWFPGDWPGQVWNNDWNVKTGPPLGEEVSLTMSTTTKENLEIERAIFVNAHSPSAKLLYELRNLGDQERNIFWTNHPDLAPGGSAGAEDLMVVPLPPAVPAVPSLAKKSFNPRLQKTHFVPGENWILGYDTKSQEYLGQIFNGSLVEKVGLWEGKNFFTMELLFNRMLIGPGEIKRFSVDYVVGRDDLDSAVRKLRNGSN